ncbi:hypothetical protein Glove_194g187 [Diversispora epigaea]|uniref:Uncharacterized protein n=1 Tax=Diversispora epigaea TaxID=1348612 RepID=A0A397ILH3_9GLOM|nr:hypothetical protein Glove_194g187 [Diversispora epigaea]
MKLIGEKKIFSISKLWKRSSPTVHSEDSQAQQPVLLAAATSNPTPPSPPSPPSPPKNLLRHLNITKFKIECAKHFKKENQVVHYCTKYLVHFPNSYKTMCNRAEAYGKLKKYDEAINDLDAAILLRPQRSTAWCLRGVVKGLKKSYTDALDDLNKAIVIDPIDCLALKWRAFCYSNLKSYEQALSDLNIVINLGCSDEFTYINRANIYRELKNPGESYKDAASGSSIKLASITDMTPKIELSSFSNPEVDNNINANALSVINDMGDKSIINNTTSTQEEPSTSTKQVSITGTISKARLSGFDDSEVNNNNSLSNFNDSKEKNIMNDNNSIQTINSASIDTTSKTVLLSLGNLEIDNINVSSNINNTEKKNDINNINPTSNETTSITGTTFKPLLSGVSEVDSKINALSNIINNFKSTQKEPSCEDERKNEINEIFDEIFNCVEKMKKYREQQQKKRNNNESNYYYSRGWKSEKKTLIIKWICLSSSPPQVTFDFPSSLINLANFNFRYSQQIIELENLSIDVTCYSLFWTIKSLRLKLIYFTSLQELCIVYRLYNSDSLHLASSFAQSRKLENLSIDVTCYSLFWTIKSLRLKLIYFTSLQELCIVYRLYNSDSLHLASSFAQSRSFHY